MQILWGIVTMQCTFLESTKTSLRVETGQCETRSWSGERDLSSQKDFSRKWFCERQVNS